MSRGGVEDSPGMGEDKHEYIERDALIKRLCERCNEEMSESPCEPSDCCVREVIKTIPAADVAPVRHARWDENGRCSNCGGHAPFWCMASTYYKSPWCQECGAKMDLEE